MSWNKDLGEELHKHYDYQAIVLLRQKIKENAKSDRTDRQTDTSRGNRELVFKDLEKSKPVFCMEYNHNSCPQSESHEGSFGGKKCIKWHICRRCQRLGELKNHPEDSEECPRRG